jgi:transposase
LGYPLRLRLTAGQAADIGQAVALVDGLAFDHLIADRGYAAQAFYDWVVASSALKMNGERIWRLS